MLTAYIDHCIQFYRRESSGLLPQDVLATILLLIVSHCHVRSDSYVISGALYALRDCFRYVPDYESWKCFHVRMEATEWDKLSASKLGKAGTGSLGGQRLVIPLPNLFPNAEIKIYKMKRGEKIAVRDVYREPYVRDRYGHMHSNLFSFIAFKKAVYSSPHMFRGTQNVQQKRQDIRLLKAVLRYLSSKRPMPHYVNLGLGSMSDVKRAKARLHEIIVQLDTPTRSSRQAGRVRQSLKHKCTKVTTRHTSR